MVMVLGDISATVMAVMVDMVAVMEDIQVAAEVVLEGKVDLVEVISPVLVAVLMVIITS